MAAVKYAESVIAPLLGQEFLLSHVKCVHSLSYLLYFTPYLQSFVEITPAWLVEFEQLIRSRRPTRRLKAGLDMSCTKAMVIPDMCHEPPFPVIGETVMVEIKSKVGPLDYACFLYHAYSLRAGV